MMINPSQTSCPSCGCWYCPTCRIPSDRRTDRRKTLGKSNNKETHE